MNQVELLLQNDFESDVIAQPAAVEERVREDPELLSVTVLLRSIYMHICVSGWVCVCVCVCVYVSSLTQITPFLTP